jgi:endonuclease/exonuclease/phosphatase family metal-dependent hydrolase
LSPVGSKDDFLESLRRYPTLAALRRSQFYAESRERIESLLSTPEIVNYAGTTPRLRSFFRVSQWNIEKGKQFAAIRDLLRSDEILRWADVILLNEADCGMIRSNNLHVAKFLAEELQMNLVFSPAHIELTKGVDEELTLRGENRASLQGNAVLSRYPIIDARVTALPQDFEPYEFREKRYGRRNCLWARIQMENRTLWAGSTHLEVRTTPQFRSRQMMCLMSELPDQTGEPYILGGDMNSNGFRRGTLWRTLQSVWRLIIQAPEAIKEELRHPERGREPLFRVVCQSGFSWKTINSDEATSCVTIEGLEDSRFLPELLIKFTQNRLRPFKGNLCFKLDWLFARGLTGLREGETFDQESGISSKAPGCIPICNPGQARISDHLPIYADLRFP